MHSISHLVCRDPRINLWITHLLFMQLVQACDSVQHFAAIGERAAGRIIQVQHRIAFAAKLDSLMIAWQERRAPQSRVSGLRLGICVLVQQHYERGKVFADRTKPIARPGADRRATGLLVTGLEERDRRIVIDRFGVHRIDDANVVRDLVVMRQHVADPLTTFAMLSERRNRRSRRKILLSRGHASQPLALANGIGQILTIQFGQRRLVIKRIDL